MVVFKTFMGAATYGTDVRLDRELAPLGELGIFPSSSRMTFEAATWRRGRNALGVTYRPLRSTWTARAT